MFKIPTFFLFPLRVALTFFAIAAVFVFLGAPSLLGITFISAALAGTVIVIAAIAFIAAIVLRLVTMMFNKNFRNENSN